MEIPNGVQTAALIAGTVITASGLNIGVIGLAGSSAPQGGTAADVAEQTPTSDASADERALTGGTDRLVVAAALIDQASIGAGEAAIPGLPVAATPPAGSPAAADAPATSGSPAPGQAAIPPAQPPGGQPAGIQPAAAAQPPAAQPPAPTQQARPPAQTRPANPPSNPQSSPPATQAPIPPPTSPSTQPPVVQTEYLTYEFDGIADIVVALHDGNRLHFWSAVKAPGWVSRVDDDGPDLVKLKFMRLSDGEEAEFEVRLTGDGDLDVKMEA